MIKEIFKYILGTPLAIISYVSSILIVLIFLSNNDLIRIIGLLLYLTYTITLFACQRSIIQLIYFYFNCPKIIYKNKIWFSLNVIFPYTDCRIISYNMDITTETFRSLPEKIKDTIDTEYHERNSKRTSKRSNVKTTINFDNV